MDRTEFKSKPHHLVTDARTGEILRIVHPSEVDVGTLEHPAPIIVYGTTTLSGTTTAINGLAVFNGLIVSGSFTILGNERASSLAIAGNSESDFFASNKGSDVRFYVSGTNFLTTSSLARNVALFGADTYFSGSIQFGAEGRIGQLTGSSGISFLDLRNNINTDCAVVSQRLSSNASTTSNIAQNSNMTFHVNSSEIWEVEFAGSVTCSGAGGVNIAINAPVSSTLKGIIYGAGNSSNVLVSSEMTTTGTLYGPFSSTAGGNRFVSARATVLVGSIQGAITVQFASATNGQTSQILSGSSFKARRATAV